MNAILKNKRIILGITGSIAAYKSQLLVRELVKAGADVNVIMTPSACKFVTPLTLENLSRNPVIVEMFSGDIQSGGAWHIHTAHVCDLMLIAPCSATTLGKLANGICDTALSVVATALPLQIPLLISPAMDTTMWMNPSTRRNIALLEKYGIIIIPPAEGELSSGFTGSGRMPEVDVLIEYIVNTLSGIIPNKRQLADTQSFESDILVKTDQKFSSLEDKIEKAKWTAELELTKMKNDLNLKENFLKGKTILISAGPTYEKIDDVRFISNYSSGKMGYALARQAQKAGANVILVSGPVSIPSPEGIVKIDVESADEMYDAVFNEFYKCDIAIMAAAVADYTTVNPFNGKLKKTEIGEKLILELQSTNDILASLGSEKNEMQKLVGFALESNNDIENGWKKLKEKNCDMLVVNSSNKPGSGFRGDDNTITILLNDGSEESFPTMSKDGCSLIILKKISEL